MQVRIEVGAERVEQRDAELAMNQLEPGAVALRLRWRVDAERQVEIVEYVQHLAKDVGRGPLGLFAPFLVDPLAVVVELGRLAQEAILQIVTLAQQGREFGRWWRGSRLILSGDLGSGVWLDGVFVGHRSNCLTALCRPPWPRVRPRRWCASSAC